MRAELCEVRRYLKSICNSPGFNDIITKAKLTPTQRKALILFIAQGCSIRKVSIEMSLSDSSIYRILCAGYESVLHFLCENKIDGFESLESQD